MSRKFGQKLDIVWNHGDDKKWRFLPMALHPGQDTSWGVWDQKEKRFLSDREVMDAPKWLLEKELHES